MAITIVQSQGSGANVSTPPRVTTMGAAFTVGNLIVVAADESNTNALTVTSPACSGGLTRVDFNRSFGCAEVWWGVCDTSGQTTVSVGGASTNDCSGNVFELAGANTTSPVVANANAGLSSTGTIAPPSVSATAGGQFYVGGGFHGQGVPNGTSPSSGFSVILSNTIGTTNYHATIYKITTGAGALTPTIAATSSGSGAVIAAIFASSGPTDATVILTDPRDDVLIHP